jgi:hypothetical protein
MIWRERFAFALRVWALFVVVHLELRRYPLPLLVERLGASATAGGRTIEPVRLGWLVTRCLTLGNQRPRCLINALILFRLLREQGDPAELVIGLPEEASNHEAHAWVEVGGVDVGPPPGQAQHLELARYR